MRYFVQLAYNGTRYSGWQIQQNAFSVQQHINEVFSTILREKIYVIGCGRTDTGVHASDFYLHFDFLNDLPKNFLHRANKMLKRDIVLYSIFPVADEMHTRFSAIERSYEYRMVGHKAPLEQETVWYNPFLKNIDFEKLQSVASLLLEYNEFFPFCKTNSDATHYRCTLQHSQWVQKNDQYWVYHVSSNRFLRGMIRLIVGMSVYVGIGKVSIETVKQYMDKQASIPQSYSAPAEGLLLSKVKYDFGQKK